MIERTAHEEALVFECAGESLVGIIAHAANSSAHAKPATRGVLIIVGGPQYRVGSHRQFTLLARRLAREGFPTMRFDYRGMGDSGGAIRPFDQAGEDIRAAIATFRRAQPQLDEIVLWGLCDAASAALLHGTRESGVSAVALLNPWVRSTESLARTHVKHYYAARLTDPDFWRGILAGRVNIVRSARDFAVAWLAGRRRTPGATASPAHVPFQIAMAAAWRAFPGPLLLVISERDLTAQEFLGHAASDAAWQGLLTQPRVSRCNLADADHTFSRASWRAVVEDQTLAWLRSW